LDLTEAIPLRNNNCKMLHTVSTQQYQYSDTTCAIGYTVAACFDLKQNVLLGLMMTVYGRNM